MLAVNLEVEGGARGFPECQQTRVRFATVAGIAAFRGQNFLVLVHEHNSGSRIVFATDRGQRDRFVIPVVGSRHADVYILRLAEAQTVFRHIHCNKQPKH